MQMLQAHNSTGLTSSQLEQLCRPEQLERTILTHNLGYVLLHSPFAGKTGMDVRGGIERVKR